MTVEGREWRWRGGNGGWEAGIQGRPQDGAPPTLTLPRGGGRGFCVDALSSLILSFEEVYFCGVYCVAAGEDG